MWRGGTFIRRLRIWPYDTASRCSMIASMCHPDTNGVDGSMIGHAWRTNSPKLRVACSWSISARREGLLSKLPKLFKFVIGQL